MLIFMDEASIEPIEWPVSVNTPVSGGKKKTYEFTGIFKRLTDDENKAIAESAVDAVSSDGDFKAKFLDNIMQVMVGWCDVLDKDSNPVEFSRNSLDAAIRSVNGLAIMAGLNRALMEISVGGVRQKN